MKALVVEADWAPRGEGAELPRRGPRQGQASPRRLANRGNLCWRNPRFAVDERPDPAPRADEVVVRVRACGICGSDVHMFEADGDGYMLYPGMVGTPVVTGHEFAGEVVAIGSDVADFAVGEPVTAEEIAWCGECRACRLGLINSCERLDELGFTFDGAHAEYVAVRARYCWSLRRMQEAGIDEGRMFRMGALVEPTAVGYVGMFVMGGGFMPGDAVGVVGAGPIGLAAIALARAAGAASVLAFEPNALRRQLALAVGADEAHDPAEASGDGQAALQRALAASGGRGLDMWVEASGAAGVVEWMSAALAPGGRLVLIGRGPHLVSLDPERLIVPGASIRGSIGHAGSGAFGRVIALMAADRLPMDRIITDTVPLADAVGALNALAGRAAGKYLVLP